MKLQKLLHLYFIDNYCTDTVMHTVLTTGLELPGMHYAYTTVSSKVTLRQALKV